MWNWNVGRILWTSSVLASLVTTPPCLAMWTVDSSYGQLRQNHVPVQMKGFVVTCTEYYLRGIGMNCFSTYNWADPSNIITTLNRGELDALYDQLLPAPQNVVPSIRLCLTAAYWLDVQTSAWQANRAKYPNLAGQYRLFVERFVADATSRGIVVILDLHWNNDVDEQQPMARKGALVGDSLTFWTQVAQKFASNPLVFYELYNEPHAPSFSVWMDGDASTYEGMRAMTTAVYNQNVQGMILVAGAFAWAYDGASLVQFSLVMPPAVMQRVAFVVHPYMGPNQAGDTKKNIDGLIRLLDEVAVTKRPVIATEFGQYCCAMDGPCYAYNGVFQDKAMGFAQAVMSLLQQRQLHWNIWAWRPNSGLGECSHPDANDGLQVYDATKHGGQGANYKVLFPAFYSNGIPVTAHPTPSTAPVATAQPITQLTKAPSSSSTSTRPTTRSPTREPSSARPTTRSPSRRPSTRSPTAKQTTGPTKQPTTAPPTIASATCAVQWGQCGGIGFLARPCCSASDSCIVSGAYYSQCRPVNSPSAPPTSTSPPTATTTVGGTATCTLIWSQCGGVNYRGRTQCCPGSACVYQNSYYSQCIPRRQLLRTVGEE